LFDDATCAPPSPPPAGQDERNQRDATSAEEKPMKRQTTGSHVATATTYPGVYARRHAFFDTNEGYHLLRRLLAEAGLRVCRVEADPDGDGWIVSAIQSTDKGAWQTFMIAVDNGRLHRARDDRQARRLLVTHLANALALRDVDS
jgi:hypothetical protein